MANPRKPDNVHRLNGTYKPDRHGDPDTKPEWSEEAPEMPDYLDDLGRAEWERVMRDTPAGVLTKTDVTILTQYCLLVSRLIAWAKFRIECSEDIEMGKLLAFTAADHTQLRLIQQELGFTPSSRGKIGGAPKKQEKTGPRILRK